jgi:hypothetical protein
MMKVVIDIIEDIREAIHNNGEFSLWIMGLKDKKNGEFTPAWQSPIVRYEIDEQKEKVFLFMGKEEPLNAMACVNELNALENKQMMYELQVVYLKENERVDQALIGFGESFLDKKYLLFVAE